MQIVLATPRGSFCAGVNRTIGIVKRALELFDLPNSSSSNRLCEIAEKQDVSSYLIEGAEALRWEWLAGRPSDRPDGRGLVARDADEAGA